MSRGLTAGMLAEIQKGRLRPAIFVECNFSSGPIYVWSGIGSKSWNSLTWVGLGKFGGISQLPETTEVRADGVQLSLSGIPSDLISLALTEIRQGKACKVYFGTLDEAGAVIADPFLSFAGRTDTANIDEGGETSTITINVENILIDVSRSHERRYTHEDQQTEYPGDLGFEFVPSLQEMNVVWGKGQPITRGPGITTGTCFSGNTRLVTQRGPVRFDEIKSADQVMTKYGLRPIADIQIHEYNGEMRDMGQGELVTPEHAIWERGGWLPACHIFTEINTFTGNVYNLHVATDVDDERNYQLANGRIAHNKIDMTDQNG